MELCEEDPLIKVWKDDIHNELYIRLFGEVQKRLSKQHFMRNIICRLLFQVRELYVWRNQLALGIPLKSWVKKRILLRNSWIQSRTW